MTKKDFELIARTIKAASDAPGYAERNRFVAVALADALAATNPLFDRARFLKACGVES